MLCYRNIHFFIYDGVLNRVHSLLPVNSVNKRANISERYNTLKPLTIAIFCI